MRFPLFLLALWGATTAPALAHSYLLKALMVGHAHMTPAVNGQSQAVFPLYNGGSQPDRLVGASSPAVRQIRLIAVDGKAVNALDLAPHKAIAMRADSTHLALEGVQPGLAPGARIPLTLTFERSGMLKIEVFLESGTAGSHNH